MIVLEISNIIRLLSMLNGQPFTNLRYFLLLACNSQLESTILSPIDSNNVVVFHGCEVIAYKVLRL